MSQRWFPDWIYIKAQAEQLLRKLAASWRPDLRKQADAALQRRERLMGIPAEEAE